MNDTKRALIVDDEPGIRYYFRAVLERIGFDCCEAKNGEEALHLLGNDSFDLMTLDVRMPGIGGLAVLREARTLDARLPIVMITALGNPEIAAAGLTESGANAFIAKPCSSVQLVSTIERVLSAF